MTGSLLIPFLADKMLGEAIKKWDIIGILLGFIGMICLTRPWASANEESKNDLIGCFFGCLAATTMALAMVYTRKLASGQYKIHWSSQTFHYVFAGLIMNSIWGFAQPSLKET
jgi:drug/metabolite transporter (DMT)-like permease